MAGIIQAILFFVYILDFISNTWKSRVTEHIVKTRWLCTAKIMFLLTSNEEDADSELDNFVAKVEEFTEAVVDFEVESFQLPGGFVDHAIEGTELVPKKAAKTRLRGAIFAAWDHSCAYCGEHADTLDHVVPRIKGGLTVRNNLVPACQRCNGVKSDADWQEWLVNQAWSSTERQLRILDWLDA
jgi:hypothetical protein